LTSNTPRSGRILGSLRSQDGVGVVRIEDRLDIDVHDLWSALTDPARLSRWYGQVEGDLHVDGEFRLFVDSSQWDGTGRVEACEPPYRVVVATRETDESWQQGRGVQPFGNTIEATLTSDGDHTTVVIEVRGIPIEMIAFYGAGWQIHAEGLAAYLDGRLPNDDVKSRFDELVPHYQELAADMS
jgi:uncharacterized protein YndB with AHSA1/START domain